MGVETGMRERMEAIAARFPQRLSALIPILWALLHVVKSVSSTPGGILSDRLGRKPLIVAGWLLYAAVYYAFGRAGSQWQAWTLFAVYGIYFGMTEGVEKALAADLVAPERRGTAFGWYNLTIGIGAIPASLLFGAVWDRWGSTAAFDVGAVLALAAAIGMSRSRFAERFTALVGMAPMAYVGEWRLQKARSRLTATEASVKEVAREAGYQSAAAFTRAFSQRFGMPPSACRVTDTAA